jgi:hypothetical protein
VEKGTKETNVTDRTVVEDAHVPAYLHLQGHLLQAATLLWQFSGADAWTIGTSRRTGTLVPWELVTVKFFHAKRHFGESTRVQPYFRIFSHKICSMCFGKIW